MPITTVTIRKDGSFILEGKLDPPVSSSTGKTKVVLSSRGNQTVKAENGTEYKYGLNVYTRA